MSSPNIARTNSRREWAGVLLLVALGVVAFAPIWHAGFIWDDDKYVTENPLLTAPDGLRRIWFSLDSPSQYFPLTYTTFYFERALWGLNPTGYHAVNLALHLLNACLAWRLLRALQVPGSWVASAIFLVHPVQVESVAWITERKNVLMGAFFLLTLLCWVRFLRAEAVHRKRAYLLALVCFALALLAKTTACTLPATLVLILWWRGIPITARRLLEVMPFILMGLGMGLLTVWWERHHQGTEGAAFSMAFPVRLLVASRAFWFYLGKMVWPVHLAFSYPRWSLSADDPRAYGWLAALVLLGAFLWRIRRQTGRGPAVAFLFFLTTLGPVLGFIMLYTFLYSFVADHYQYLACLGPIALGVAGMKAGLERMAPRQFALPVVVSVGVLTALTVLCWRQCLNYRSAEDLWRATLTENPASWLAHNNLGTILRQSGRVPEAIAQYQEAVKIAPQNGSVHFNLARAYFQSGDTGHAITEFQAAWNADPADKEAANNLAWLLATASTASLRDGTRAVSLARVANNLAKGKNPAILRTLGAALAEAGQFGEATAVAEDALAMAQANVQTDLATRLANDLRRYAAKEPLHR